MFGASTLGATPGFGAPVAAASMNPMKDFDVASPPEDSVSAMEFSPASMQQNFLIAGSWDSSVRCWEVEQTGKTIPKSMKTMGGPVLDVCWADVSNFFDQLRTFGATGAAGAARNRPLANALALAHID